MDDLIAVASNSVVSKEVALTVAGAVLGAGVAGAIRDKGGPSIQAECDRIGPIEVGDAAVTGAGQLNAQYVIHAAGMPPGGEATEQSIRSSVARSLTLASERGCRSIAIPAIGAGIGGFSTQRCAEILLAEAREQLRSVADESCWRRLARLRDAEDPLSDERLGAALLQSGTSALKALLDQRPAADVPLEAAP